MRSQSPWHDSLHSCSSPEHVKQEPSTPSSSPPESACLEDDFQPSPPSDSKEFAPDEPPPIAILPPLSGPLSPATVIQSHYRTRFHNLFGQLAIELESLPPLVPSTDPPVSGWPAFERLAGLPARKEFKHLQAVLCEVWGTPGGIRIEHVTRGARGTRLVLSLLERVGADALSRLDDDEREEAVAWVRAMWDAAKERG